MSKRSRDGVNIPGMLLDQIKNTESFDNDDRFNFKKRKGGKQVSRKEKRKNERQLKKQKKSNPTVDSRYQSNGPLRQNNHQHQQQQQRQRQNQQGKTQKQSQSKNNTQINKHNVSDSFDKHTTAVNTKLNKTVPSQFVEDPNKSKKSKKSKSVQFSEKNEIRSIENRASLNKYNDSDSDSSSEDMYYGFENGFFDDDEADEDEDEELAGYDEEDEDEKRTWEALMQLKKGKSTNGSSEIRTVKEDEISDDEISADEMLASESESESSEDSDNNNNDEIKSCKEFR